MRPRVIFAACVLAASAVSAQIQPPMKPVSMQQDTGTLGIWPGDPQEVCHALKRGEKRRYSFTSNAPLEFNIHYHLEETVIYPALGHDMRSKEGIMAAGADGEEIYCWMWVNLRMRPAELTFRIWEDAP